MTNATLRKNSKSGQFNCVEVALTSNNVAVRNSKNPDQGHLTITRDQWRSFLRNLGTSRGQR